MLIKLLLTIVTITILPSESTRKEIRGRFDPTRPFGYFNRIQKNNEKRYGAEAFEPVALTVYYESLCPDARKFFTEQMTAAYAILGPYVVTQLLPYGKAKTYIDDKLGLQFQCHHGPAECYGNKLHACAIAYLPTMRQAVIFNACMMDFSNQRKGSDDIAADKCGIAMKIDAGPIKTCAKGPRGSLLLKQHGTVSARVPYKYVPHVTINGIVSDGRNLVKDLCESFVEIPGECYVM